MTIAYWAHWYIEPYEYWIYSKLYFPLNMIILTSFLIRWMNALTLWHLPVPYVPARVTRGALIAHRYTYARCRTSQCRRTFIFPSQYLSGTIWLTTYSMVWDWRVSRAGPMPFYWPSCPLLFCLQLFSLSLLFLYRLVVWGWGLRTDRVSISLSRPCIANLFG